ncbi:uncharacterized protein LOC121253498 [Juglans microcarpa x Juglans regia]|uniref:uncharacterized protein LOC121253498 n=1 Tax=Juglans microcarpa x Juglans regia TaxID=2249226 RepID=UPI001B7E021E|nr:uncharacterized protein LOC121253498 [Juglans microcarpa x Juglans regia]
MEELEELWEQMKLTEEEMETIELNEEDAEVVIKKGELCLVGKVCVDRVISKSVIMSIMSKIWCLSKPTVFQVVGKNCFVVVFNNHADKLKVEGGRPWLFDNNLFILKAFEGDLHPGKILFDCESMSVQLHNLPLARMNRDTGERIGRSIGRVLEVDVDEKESGWGQFLRVKVEIDLKKPLARGRTIFVSSSR